MSKFKECREKKGLSQKYVAVMLGVSPSAISQWEKGTTYPSSENLAKLAEIYGVSIDHLMGKCNEQEEIKQPIIFDTGRLRRLRTERMLTQKELGEELGLSESIVCLYEKGEREPSFSILCRLADFFGVTTDYLLGRSDIRWPYTHAPDGMVIGIPVEAQKAPASGEAGGKPRTISLSADDVLAGSDEPLRAYIQQLVREELEKATREK